MKKSLINLFAALALLGFAACVDVPELPYPTPGDDTYPTVTGSLPFTSNSLNDFTVQTITGNGWSLGSSYAKASGYADNVTTATQTWLVSPAINTTMQGTEGIVINFNYVLRYVKSSTDVNGYHRVMASTDYAGDVTTATWTNLGFAPVESATQDWTFYAATPVALPETLWNEEKVYIAFYFECTDANSTTWELKELTITEGKIDGFIPPTPPVDVVEATIEEFNAAPVSTSVWYQLTGTVGSLKAGDVFGNFDLTDATGSVYVYGLLAEKGGAQRKFQELIAATGLAAGDKITIIGQRGDYNGKVEVLNAYLMQIVEKGQGGDGGDTTPPVDGKYTVAQVIAAGNPATQAWVKGYIVGSVPDKSYSSATFTADGASQTNLLLADDANCTDANKCIPVQLPAGSIRTSLNLLDNPSNLGKFIYLYGSLEKYFGVPGLKNVTDYNYDGNGGGNDGGNAGGNAGGGTDPAKLPYTADFTKSACNFKAQDVELTGGLTYVWAQSASYGWKASAYKITNQAAESWLVSPTIDLTSTTSPVMTVNHALNYLSGATATDFVNICVSTDYTDDATKATWTNLTVPTWPSGADWNFVDSGDISLSAFAGKKVTVALHYKSTTATAPTWEVKSLSVK